MGGFLLGLTMERWGLHRRLALSALRLAGDRPAAIVGAFIAVAALLSMWISNTATAVMMLPVAISVIELFEKQLARGSRRAASPSASSSASPTGRRSAASARPSGRRPTWWSPAS